MKFIKENGGFGPKKFFLLATRSVEFFECAIHLVLETPYKNAIGLKKRKCFSAEIVLVLLVLHAKKINLGKSRIE